MPVGTEVDRDERGKTTAFPLPINSSGGILIWPTQNYCLKEEMEMTREELIITTAKELYIAKFNKGAQNLDYGLADVDRAFKGIVKIVAEALDNPLGKKP